VGANLGLLLAPIPSPSEKTSAPKLFTKISTQLFGSWGGVSHEFQRVKVDQLNLKQTEQGLFHAKA
jgi:hypothetical protein